MKKIFTFFSLVALYNIFVNAKSGWTAQTSGTTNVLNSVYFTDSITDHAVGVSGTILGTNNGGSLWTPKTSGTSNILYSVFVTDANTRYTLGGNSTILKNTSVLK